MTKRYSEPLTAEKLAALSDSEIDYSDIPKTDADFWQDAQVIMPEQKEKISIRLNPHTLDYFKRGGRGYQTRISAVLDTFVATQERLERST